MKRRILLAALLAGIALFAWEAVAHMLTPLAQMGLKTLPDEAAALSGLKAAIQESGLYLFPAPELRPGMTSEQKQAATELAMQKYRQGPSGMVLLLRHGADMMSPAQLLIQCAADILAMLIAALILAQISPSVGPGMRMMVVLLMSLIPSLRSGIPFVNWYHFPKSLMGAAFLIDFVGYAIGGLILVKLVQGRSRTMPAGS